MATVMAVMYAQQVRRQMMMGYGIAQYVNMMFVLSAQSDQL